MGTRIVVMKAGYVQQIDTPQNLYKYPGNVFVAGFIGTPQMNFFDGVIEKNGESVSFKLDNGVNVDTSYAFVNKIHIKYMDGEHRIVVGVRPEDIRLFEDSFDESIWQKAQANVDVVEALGGETLLHCKFDDNSEIVVKVNGECLARTGDIIDIAINKKNIHVFDKETENRINVRIPSENTFNVAISGAQMSIGNQHIALPSRISQVAGEGQYVLSVPSDAITLGHGQINAIVKGKEIIGNKALYELDIDGSVAFAVTDKDVDIALGEVNLTIDMAKVSLNGDAQINALNTQNKLDGTFVRVKEKDENGKKTIRYYMQIGEQKLHSPDTITEKLFLCKGIKTFKTPFGYIFDSSAVSVCREQGEDMLCGSVSEILDYGDKKYAKIAIENAEIIVENADELQANDNVYIAIDYRKLSVKDNEIDMLVI